MKMPEGCIYNAGMAPRWLMGGLLLDLPVNHPDSAMQALGPSGQIAVVTLPKQLLTAASQVCAAHWHQGPCRVQVPHHQR